MSSLEALADEERREVLALLGQHEMKARGSGSNSGPGSALGNPRRTSSPFTAGPRSPVRSMLDIEEGVVSRNTSNGGSATSQRKMGPVRSMLDIHTPLPTAAATRSAQTSPTTSNHRARSSNQQHPRSLSDTGSRPVALASGSRPNPTTAYQFSGYLPVNPGGAVVPRRNTQAGKAATNAMAEVVRATDLGATGGRDKGRHHSVTGTGIGTSTSKSLRSHSPHTGMLSPEPISTLVLDNGDELDMSNAYRRLSDANLARSKGGLSALPERSRRRRAGSDALSANGARLEKDYTPLEGEDTVADSSDDAFSSDEERHRGRRKGAGTVNRGEGDGHPESKTLGMGRAKGPRTARSLMAAAEEERQLISSQMNDKYKVRSLLEPEITVTGPSGDRLRTSKPGVHPNTAFDEGNSGLNTPHDSDTEADLTDIKRAQKLSVNMTPIISTPASSRCVRTLVRGDFSKMQQEARENQRRVRTYLVATDLSEEAAHALEWTIGTVLRDGDTLLAIYCVDEEIGIATVDNSGDDASFKEQAAAVGAIANQAISTPILKATAAPSPLSQAFKLESNSASASPMGRERSKSEHERYRAVQDITDRVSKLLRKTKLQVKVVIEVIHCKSPKHLITEVIDFISPTLVILGSRGRSALKGVILGSFSNYLVTKSSVPVMVARKKLRKHNKYKRPEIKLANNLGNPAVKSLASAKID